MIGVEVEVWGMGRVGVGVSFGAGVRARVKVRLRTCVRGAAMAEGARSEASSSRRPAAMLSSGRFTMAAAVVPAALA